MQDCVICVLDVVEMVLVIVIDVGVEVEVICEVVVEVQEIVCECVEQVEEMLVEVEDSCVIFEVEEFVVCVICVEVEGEFFVLNVEMVVLKWFVECGDYGGLVLELVCVVCGYEVVFGVVLGDDLFMGLVQDGLGWYVLFGYDMVYFLFKGIEFLVLYVQVFEVLV